MLQVSYSPTLLLSCCPAALPFCSVTASSSCLLPYCPARWPTYRLAIQPHHRAAALLLHSPTTMLLCSSDVPWSYNPHCLTVTILLPSWLQTCCFDYVVLMP